MFFVVSLHHFPPRTLAAFIACTHLQRHVVQNHFSNLLIFTQGSLACKGCPINVSIAPGKVNLVKIKTRRRNSFKENMINVRQLLDRDKTVPALQSKPSLSSLSKLSGTNFALLLYHHPMAIPCITELVNLFYGGMSGLLLGLLFTWMLHMCPHPQRCFFSKYEEYSKAAPIKCYKCKL